MLITCKYSFNDFKEQFSQYGTLYEISLPASKKNPRNHCGYGFVNYTNAADTEKAIREGNKLTIKGRTVAVDYAVPKDIYQKLKVETVPQKTERYEYNLFYFVMSQFGNQNERRG